VVLVLWRRSAGLAGGVADFNMMCIFRIFVYTISLNNRPCAHKSAEKTVPMLSLLPVRVTPFVATKRLSSSSDI
jgi:hypothetical protein